MVGRLYSLLTHQTLCCHGTGVDAAITTASRLEHYALFNRAHDVVYKQEAAARCAGAARYCSSAWR